MRISDWSSDVCSSDLLVESVLMGDTSIVGGVKQAINNIARIEVRKFTEQLFAGADEKIRELLRGQNGVDRAIGLLEKSADRGGTSVGNFATAVEQIGRASCRERVCQYV